MPDVVDLVDVCSPPKDLVVTCRRLHVETSGLYKEAYRACWSETTFQIDMFGNEPDKEERRPLDEDKKARVFAKVQELCDDDVSHTSHAYVPYAEEGEFFELGDAIWDTWSLHYPRPDVPKHKAVQLFYPLENTDALEDAGLKTSTTCASKSFN